MSNRDRALWQAAAARVRQHYADTLSRYGSRRKPPRVVTKDRMFAHQCLLKLSRDGVPFDPYWWA